MPSELNDGTCSFMEEFEQCDEEGETNNLLMKLEDHRSHLHRSEINDFNSK